jgi:hypothetical protein
MIRDETMGRGDQVGVVDDPELRLPPPVGGQRPGHVGALRLGLVLFVGWEILRGAQVVAQLSGERGELVHPPARCREVQGGRFDGAECLTQQLAGVTRSDDGGGALDADERTELAEQAVRETVVGVHFDLAPVLDQPGQQLAEASGEFLGGLVGEGDPERLLRLDHPALHQVPQSESHRRGLPGAGAGGDPQRLQWEPGDLALLGGGLDGHPR